MELHAIRRFYSHCHIAVIDPKGKRFPVTKFGLKTVSQTARMPGAQLVINGGDFNALPAVGLHVAEGRVDQGIQDYQPWINFTRSHQPQINGFNSRETPYNALAGKRVLVLDKRIPGGTSQAWRATHRHVDRLTTHL